MVIDKFEQAYIKTALEKEIPVEFQRITTFLSNEPLGIHQTNCTDLPVFENTAIVQRYENIDARGKINDFKKHSHDKKKSDYKVLKRKLDSTLHSPVASKKISFQPTDTLSTDVDNVSVEYCNAPSHFITVESREYQHTLRPQNVHAITLAGNSSTPNQNDNVVAEGSAAFTSDGRESTDAIFSATIPNTGKRSIGGNGDDSEDDEIPQQKKYTASEWHHQISKFNAILKDHEQWLEKHKSEKDHLEHAYNECKFVSGEQSYCESSNAQCQQAKAFFDEHARKAMDNENSLNQGPVRDVFMHHAFDCRNKNTQCKVPYCHELYKSIQKDVITSDVAQDYSFNGLVAPEVLLSNVSDISEYSEDSSQRNTVDINQLRFLFPQEIGKGSFGQVYKSWVSTKSSEACMAVKIMAHTKQENPDIDEIAQFIRTLGKSPYLLTPDLILSSNKRELSYLIMERGEISLHAYVKKSMKHHNQICSKADHIGPCNSALPPDVVCKFFEQIMKGLNYLHQRELVHADVKSQNIVLVPGFQIVKLIDFDMVKHESTKKQCGTPGYIGPEIVGPNGSCTKPSDIFAASHLIPEMFFGLDMRYRDFKDAEKYIEWIKERSIDLYDNLKNHVPELAKLFRLGTQQDPLLRPTSEAFLRCFRENKVIRDLSTTSRKALSYEHVPNSSNVVKESQDSSPEKKKRRIAQNIVRSWRDDKLKKLPSTLPLSSVGNTTPTTLYDSTWFQAHRSEMMDDDIDVPVERILCQTFNTTPGRLVMN